MGVNLNEYIKYNFKQKGQVWGKYDYMKFHTYKLPPKSKLNMFCLGVYTHT